MPRWVGERIIEVFSREFRAHPQHEYVSIRCPKAYKLSEPTLKVSDFSQKCCTLQERSINAGTLTVNYEKVKILENITQSHTVLTFCPDSNHLNSHL